MVPEENILKKIVYFNENCNVVHRLVKWNYAYRQARKSDYQRIYLDRLRFEKRIAECEQIFCKILDVDHRFKIYCERFNKTT